MTEHLLVVKDTAINAIEDDWTTTGTDTQIKVVYSTTRNFAVYASPNSFKDFL